MWLLGPLLPVQRGEAGDAMTSPNWLPTFPEVELSDYVGRIRHTFDGSQDVMLGWDEHTNRVRHPTG